MNNVDPSGHFAWAVAAAVAWVAISIGITRYDTYQFYKKPSLMNFVLLAVDIAFFGTGASEVSASLRVAKCGAKAASKISKSVTAAKTSGKLGKTINKLKKSNSAVSKTVVKKIKKLGEKVVKKESKGGTATIPDKAVKIANKIESNGGAALKGYKGGRKFKNIPHEKGAQKLPEGVNYKEYDVNPFVKGQNRGTERLVIGDDGSKWYTNDHYFTFTKLK